MVIGKVAEANSISLTWELVYSVVKPHQHGMAFGPSMTQRCNFGTIFHFSVIEKHPIPGESFNLA